MGSSRSYGFADKMMKKQLVKSKKKMLRLEGQSSHYMCIYTRIYYIKMNTLHGKYADKIIRWWCMRKVARGSPLGSCL